MLFKVVAGHVVSNVSNTSVSVPTFAGFCNEPTTPAGGDFVRGGGGSSGPEDTKKLLEGAAAARIKRARVAQSFDVDLSSRNTIQSTRRQGWYEEQ